ncbi:PTS sugar transporter subunit IIA [Halopiger aswanensis]|uniref:PTS system D-fructose-specific IIA component (F1P-forming) (Frc family) n=1 Tax=Halopiger aswanensis TaxID=148449 RepID=A0A3R7E1T9_9EURY|nr:PTS sugar transporter subunit IIA [Halopiger aswanensis]RKD98014.1 PTS system D-fructose-specific IIA component (F1P-forming) (Frc family) [Halopiger aswanensis]
MDDEIDAVLAPELITLREPPTDKGGCIEYLLDRAVDAGRVTDRDEALEAIRSHEAEMGAGVGKGIGLFHAKTDAVDRPTIAFARSSEGVAVETSDGEPATLLFLLLAPTEATDEHLAILSSLSRALMHAEVRTALHEAESAAAARRTLAEAIG